MMLELKNICKTYTQGKLEVPVLKEISLSVEEGEYVAIMGSICWRARTLPRTATPSFPTCG